MIQTSAAPSEITVLVRALALISQRTMKRAIDRPPMTATSTGMLTKYGDRCCADSLPPK